MFDGAQADGPPEPAETTAQTALLVAPPQVSAGSDDALVEEAIAHIRRIWSHGLLATVVALGDYLIKTFYAGDLRDVRSRRAHKPAALARLLARADELPVTAHALKQSMRMAAQYHALPRSVAEALSKTQHEALLPVGDLREKVALAREAAAGGLTSRELADRIADRGEPSRGARGGGRRALPRVARRVGAVLRALDAPGFEDDLRAEALAGLPAAELERMREQVRGASERLARVREALGESPGPAPPAGSVEALDGLLATVDEEVAAFARWAPERQRLAMQVWLCRARSIREASPGVAELAGRVATVEGRLGDLQRAFQPGVVRGLEGSAQATGWHEAAKRAERALGSYLRRWEALDAEGWADGGFRDPAPPAPDAVLGEAVVELDALLGAGEAARAPGEEGVDALLRVARRLRWVRGRVRDDVAWGTAMGRLRGVAEALGGGGKALREALDPAVWPAMPWGALLDGGEAARPAVSPRVAEVVAAMPRDAGGEALAAWVVGAMDVLNTAELAAAVMPVRERVAALGEVLGRHGDRRVRRRFRELVRKVEGMGEGEARRVRAALGVAGW